MNANIDYRSLIIFYCFILLSLYSSVIAPWFVYRLIQHWKLKWSVTVICRSFLSYCLQQTTTPFCTYYSFREHVRYDIHHLQITHCRYVTDIMEHTEYIPWTMQSKLLIHFLWSCFGGCNAIVLLELMLVKLCQKIWLKSDNTLPRQKHNRARAVFISLGMHIPFPVSNIRGYILWNRPYSQIIFWLLYAYSDSEVVKIHSTKIYKYHNMFTWISCKCKQDYTPDIKWMICILRDHIWPLVWRPPPKSKHCNNEWQLGNK